MTVGETERGTCGNTGRDPRATARGDYQPQPVKRQWRSRSPGGGMRELGIPTVLDRLIQQALLQVLQPLLTRPSPSTATASGPDGSAHQAVLAAQALRAGRAAIVVDVDLEKFFDRVNHDILMGTVGQAHRRQAGCSG
jgi:RNA-directed DNA polymerase